MSRLKSLSLSAAAILAVAGGVSAVAQQPNYPWVEMDTTSFALGLAGQTGEGILHLPNLGTNCDYPFRVSGFGGGIQAGISQVAASRLASFATMMRSRSRAAKYAGAEARGRTVPDWCCRVEST